jgi:hypothetical protein
MNDQQNQGSSPLVASPEEMRVLRLESSKRAAATMTREQMLAQMRKSGSIVSSNPWYRGRRKATGSET